MLEPVQQDLALRITDRHVLASRGKVSGGDGAERRG